MKKFKFTTKISEESISTCLAENYKAAVLVFSTTKKLTPEEFLNIYKVEEVNESSPKH